MGKKKSKNHPRSKGGSHPATATTSTSTTATSLSSTNNTQDHHNEPSTTTTTPSPLPKPDSDNNGHTIDSFSKSPEAPNQDLSLMPLQLEHHHPQNNGARTSINDHNDDSTRIDQEQEAWSSFRQARNTPVFGNAVGDDPFPVDLPAPRRYEYDDEDDEDGDYHPSSEQSPLIREDSRDGTEDRRSGAARVQRAHPESDPPKTWLEWSLKHGLHPRTWTRQTYIKAGLLSTLLTLIILSFTVFRIQDHIKDVLQYIDSHKRIGAALFVLSYTVACTLFLPGSLFTIGAGFIFKPAPLALAIVLLGDVFAAASSFVFGRYVFYDWVKGMMSRHPKFNALDQVIKDDGWKIVVMLRMTPIPFSLITYFFSITSIRLFTVVWATCVGVLPGSCIGIWIGSLLKGLSGIENPELENKNLVILVMNGVFIVCCILTLSIFGKRSLRNAMKRLEQHQALTSLPEVEVVVEGVATVIRDLEDRASIPPSFRSTMIEQLAAEETDPDYYSRRDLEAAQRRLLSDSERREGDRGEEGQGESSSRTSATVTDVFNHHPHNKTHGNEAGMELASGFTRGEKITLVAIAAAALVNVCVCVPLYYHFASQDD